MECSNSRFLFHVSIRIFKILYPSVTIGQSLHCVLKMVIFTRFLTPLCFSPVLPLFRRGAGLLVPAAPLAAWPRVGGRLCQQPVVLAAQPQGVSVQLWLKSQNLLVESVRAGIIDNSVVKYYNHTDFHTGCSFAKTCM